MNNTQQPLRKTLDELSALSNEKLIEYIKVIDKELLISQVKMLQYEEKLAQQTQRRLIDLLEKDYPESVENKE